MGTNFVVKIEPELYSLSSKMFNEHIYYIMKTMSPEYVTGRKYMCFMDFHMFICILQAFGYMEGLSFNTDVFYKLAKHKKKIQFEFIVSESAHTVRLTKLIYIEKPDRMGLVIKKSIMKTFIEAGYALKFEPQFSRVTNKSFFSFN